jgi:hypothetical protein
VTKMPKFRTKKHYTSLPLPPCSPNWCAFEAGMIAAQLIRKHHAKKWQVHYLLGMLHERYLVSLPRLKKDKTVWCNTSSLRLRWLWCEWVGKLLGWKETRLEGHPNGLSAEVHATLRDKIFPIPKIERDEPVRGSKVAAAQSNAT